METTHASASTYAPPAALARLQGPALVAGAVGLVVAGLGFFVDRGHFFQGWLLAWLFWLAVTLGCLGLAMLNHMTHGAWGLMVRRPLEAASRTLPFLLLAFIPVALGVHDLYEWSHPEAVAANAVLQAKAAYLNVPFFLVRAGIYFAIWIYFAWQMARLSRRQDETADPKLYSKLQGHGAAGFLILALTVSFASIDWMMSIDPHWFSSLYGLWFFAGMGLSGLTFSIVVASWLSRREPLAGKITPRIFHDYGKLFFAFTMLWAYLSFSQFLLMWAGNLPEEIPFYLDRAKPGWMATSMFLLLAHFVFPFLILLSADVKQRSHVLVKVAIWMLVMRWVDLFWNVVPALNRLHEQKLGPVAGLWIDLAAVVGLGGIWVWFFLRNLRDRPILPVNDPFLAEALAHD